MTERRILSEVFESFERLGWRDAGGTALTLASHIEKHGARTVSALEQLFSPEFLARNGLSRRSAARTLRTSGLPYPGSDSEGSPATLLLLSADPTDQDALRIQTEQRIIREELERSPLGRILRIELRPGLLRTDIARYLLEVRPTVVHFSGHGDTQAIVVENPLGGSAPVANRALGDLFAMPAVQASVRLVVLSSCLSDGQAAAIVRSTPAVIGMKGSIRDDAALAFSRGLYMALGQGLSVQEAYDFGRNALMIEDIPQERLPILLTGDNGRRLKPFAQLRAPVVGV